MSELIIEVGRFYKTRCGCKARIYSVKNGFIFPYHGAVNTHGDEWMAMNWGHDAKCFGSAVISGKNYSQDALDLVAPWTDPPEVAWEKLPLGILAVVIDDEDNAMGCLTPRVIMARDGHGWLVGPKDLYGFSPWIDIPRDVITFTGDWRDSLVIRPGYEENTSCTRS